VKCETTTTTPVARPLFQDNLGKPVTEKVKTSLDLNEARDDGDLGRHWHQLDINMQTICTSLQTDTNNSLLIFTGRICALPDAQPTVSKHRRFSQQNVIQSYIIILELRQ